MANLSVAFKGLLRLTTQDPEDIDFTLEHVFTLGLDSYAEVISNLSVSASKELAIEQSLKDIETKWAELKLDRNGSNYFYSYF